MLSLFGFRMSAVVRNSGTGYFARNPLSKSAQTTSHALNSLSAASEPPRMSRLILEGHDQLQSFPLVYQWVSVSPYPFWREPVCKVRLLSSCVRKIPRVLTEFQKRSHVLLAVIRAEWMREASSAPPTTFSVTRGSISQVRDTPRLRTGDHIFSIRLNLAWICEAFKQNPQCQNCGQLRTYWIQSEPMWTSRSFAVESIMKAHSESANTSTVDWAYTTSGWLRACSKVIFCGNCGQLRTIWARQWRQTQCFDGFLHNCLWLLHRTFGNPLGQPRWLSSNWEQMRGVGHVLLCFCSEIMKKCGQLRTLFWVV